MLRLSESQKEIQVVEDQIGSPTFAWDLATAIVSIVDALAGGLEEGFGLYHATNTGATSWHGFAEKIFEFTRNTDVSVLPIRTEEYPTPAPRPAYSVLSCERLHRVFGITLPDWRDATARCLMRLERKNFH